MYTADFTPCTEGWQYAEVQFAKAQFATVESLKVYCDYDYNNGVAYFDDIQLVRDAIETDLTEANTRGRFSCVDKSCVISYTVLG